MRYFVSGHRDLTKEEFDKHYIPKLVKILQQDPYTSFVVGDWEGCDEMFIDFINEFRKITIHLYYVCLNKLSVCTENYGYYHKCESYDECDANMTANSDFDIAWIRPGKENSHTANNIKRRYGI